MIAVEILLNDGSQVRHFRLTPARIKIALTTTSLLMGTMLVSIGGWLWTSAHLSSAEQRVSELEKSLENERASYARVAEELGAVAARADDIGKGVGMLNLAFGALFAEDAVAIQEQQNPEMAAYRRHLDDLKGRYDRLSTSLDRMTNDMSSAAKGFASGPSGNRQRVEALKDVREQITAMLARMEGWKQDDSFPNVRSYNQARDNAAKFVTALAALEQDVGRSVRRSDEELFGGAPAEVCMGDPDRVLVSISTGQAKATADLIAITEDLYVSMQESLKRTGLGETRAFPNGTEAFADALESLKAAAGKMQAVRDSFGQVPIGTPVEEYFITSGFGIRKDPFRGKADQHEGLDFAAARGAPVSATADGIVKFAGQKPGYGNLVEIDHGNGLLTRYGHLQRIDAVQGKLVQRDTLIGLVGSTGRSTGPHLHYEVVIDGKVSDPKKFMRAAALSGSCSSNDEAAKKHPEIAKLLEEVNDVP